MRPDPLSAIVMDHFLHPRGMAVIHNPDGEGWAGSVEAHRYMRMQVKVQDSVLSDVAFGTYGCAPAIAAGSFVCEWAQGKTVAQAQALTSDELTTMLGGLPAARRFCADLAVDALHAALTAAGATASTPPAGSPPSDTG
jgi:nitrogen fixation NifU-like protein